MLLYLSVLWHCWLGHISLTRKIVSEYDLYCVEWDVKPYYTYTCYIYHHHCHDYHYYWIEVYCSDADEEVDNVIVMYFRWSWCSMSIHVYSASFCATRNETAVHSVFASWRRRSGLFFHRRTSDLSTCFISRRCCSGSVVIACALCTLLASTSGRLNTHISSIGIFFLA